MGRARTIARRGFLIGSLALAGGVAFGAYLVRKDPDNPLADEAGPETAVFNPWVMIAPEGITLIAPHTDLGQGARSMQAALIAEELDVEFGQFTISPGVPSAAYYNTALAADAAPFSSTDDSFVAETTRKALGAVIKVLGSQATGGSSSVPDSFYKLRLAGAVARETLKAAAAQKTGIAVEALSTANAAVILPDGTALPYTELAAIAATLEPVRDVVLRRPEDWRLIGKPMMRADILGKSTGTLAYGIDLVKEGMLHAAVRLNPRRSGLRSYSAEGVRAMRGVRAVLELRDGLAVVADNTWRAFRAAEALEIDWGEAAYPAEQADHWAAVAAAFAPEHLDRTWRDDGDTEEALAAGVAFDAEYRAPYVAHQPLEPLSATILVAEDRVDIWVASQMPRYAQDRVARITGYRSEDVHLHNQFAGGSFGHRLEFESIDRVAEIGAQMKGTPIKLTFSREEDFAQDFARPIGMARARGAVRDGRVEALDLRISSLSPTRSQLGRLGQPAPGPDGQIVAGAWNQPFDIPNFRVSGHAVPALAPVSSWRSVGASSAGFFCESAMDELIHAAGADPMAERLRLVSDEVSRKVLEAVAEMSGWGSPLAPERGRGLAFVNSFGVPCAEVVEVTRIGDGIRIDKVFVALDVGRVVDPVNFDNQVKGGVIWGLGHAMNAEITFADGMAEQTNFHTHEGMRFAQCPVIVVRALENGNLVRGVGEPPVPPAAPALANAIFAATGQRIREMPFNRHIDFV